MSDSVLSVIRGDQTLSTFASAVDAVAGRAEHLDRAVAVTVLAPTDEAFAALDEAVARQLVTSPQRLAAILRHHVAEIGDPFGATGMVAMDGAVIVVGGTVETPTFDGATSRSGTVVAANGTVVVIDSVIVPVPS